MPFKASFTCLWCGTSYTTRSSDDLEGLAVNWKRCLSTGTPSDGEARIRRHDGSYRWFVFRANPLRDETGAIVKWYGTNIDIEDHKRADALMREGIELLALLDRRSALCVRSFAGIYRGLLEQMRRRGFDVFTERPHLSTVEKLKAVASL